MKVNGCSRFHWCDPNPDNFFVHLDDSDHNNPRVALTVIDESALMMLDDMADCPLLKMMRLNASGAPISIDDMAGLIPTHSPEYADRARLSYYQSMRELIYTITHTVPSLSSTIDANLNASNREAASIREGGIGRRKYEYRYVLNRIDTLTREKSQMMHAQRHMTKIAILKAINAMIIFLINSQVSVIIETAM